MTGSQYSFSKKFVEGEMLSGFWNMLFQIAAAANSFIVISYLDVYEYGLYQLVLSVSAVALSLTAGAFDDLVATDLSKYLGKQELGNAKRLFREYAVFKAALGLLFLIGFLIGAEKIAGYYGQNIANFIRIIGFAFLFGIFNSIINIFFRAKIYFRALGTSALGEIGKLSVILVILLWAGLGVREVLISYAAGQAITFLIGGVHFLRIYSREFRDIPATRHFFLKDFVKTYGVWMILRYIFSRVANNIRPWIIKLLLNTEAVGLFAFSRNVIGLIARMMPLGTLGSLLPRELDDKNKLHYIFARIFKYSLFSGVVLALTSFFLIPSAIKYIFPHFLPAVPILQIMTGFIIIYSVYKILRIYLVVFKEQKILFLRSFDNSVLAPLTLFILLPLFGVLGIGLEWVLTYAITTVFFYRYLMKAHPYLKLKTKEIFLFDSYDKELILRNFSEIKNIVYESFSKMRRFFRRT